MHFTFLQLYVFHEFALHFSVLVTKIYPILYFVVQFSQFLIWHNGPPAMLAVANSSVWKYVSSGWCTASSDSCAHHVTLLWPSAHERIFPLSRSKQFKRTMPAFGMMHPRLTVIQQVYFVSPMYDKCNKQWPLQHSDHCVFLSEIFYRNSSRLIIRFSCAHVTSLCKDQILLQTKTNFTAKGLFISPQPRKTLTFQGHFCHRGTKSEQLVTVLLTCNKDGGVKLTLQ
jgi:hypothetical protein